MLKSRVLLYAIFVVFLCQACALRPEIRKLTHKVRAKIEKAEIANRPPWGIETYQIQESPPVNILFALPSDDKYGHKRIQLFIHLAQKANAAFYWKLIERYQGEYDVIWFALTSKSEKPLEKKHWSNQGVWYAEHVPQSLVHPGFPVEKAQKGLYLQYAY